TTEPKAAPMTTPTARSTTLPRRMNCLNPLSMGMEPPKQEAANLRCGSGVGQAELCSVGRTLLSAAFEDGLRIGSKYKVKRGGRGGPPPNPKVFSSLCAADRAE